jgi:hypothetical protein
VPPKGRPGPHPQPPSDLSSRRLPFERIGGPLFRVHASRHGVLHFGTSGDNRFDDPRRAYGVLYAGLSAACAFIETLSDPPWFAAGTLIDAPGGRAGLVAWSTSKAPRGVP